MMMTVTYRLRDGHRDLWIPPFHHEHVSGLPCILCDGRQHNNGTPNRNQLDKPGLKRKNHSSMQCFVVVCIKSLDIIFVLTSVFHPHLSWTVPALDHSTMINRITVLASDSLFIHGFKVVQPLPLTHSTSILLPVREPISARSFHSTWIVNHQI
jgi:hypothetical protein